MIKLKSYCNINTLITEAMDGNLIASFIMPAGTLNDTSLYKCKIDARTGHLDMPTKQQCVRKTSALEMDWAAYRYGAWNNRNTVQKLVKDNKLIELLTCWLNAVPAEYCKLYLGGEATCVKELLYIISAVRKTEKKVYMQLTNADMLATIKTSLRIPDNFIIGIERPYYALQNYKIVQYTTEADGCNELTHFPQSTDTIIKFLIDEDCIRSSVSKEPMINTMLLV